jgi:hypothetical protein
MRITRTLASVALLAAALSCSDNPADPSTSQGRIALRLTDAPFPLDEVESIDVFVVRIEAKAEATSEEDADENVEANAQAQGWVVLATPNASFDLMTLQNGVSVSLGDATVEAGTYRSIRLILDTEQSSITLKNDMVLSASSVPSILFPSAGKTGIKVMFDTPIDVEAGETTELLIDFDAEESFVLRGNTILQNGLLFKPVIRASIL